MTARRVPNDNDTRQIEMMLHCERTNMIDGVAHVKIGVRPAAAWLIHAPVFDVQCRDATPLQRVASRREVRDRTVGLEASAMNQHGDRMWTRPTWYPQLGELIRVRSVSQTFVRRLRRN